MFPLQIELTTDDWPHETSWRLALDNGTEVDSVDERYYTELNALYSHRYCLHVGSFVFSIEDMIGDGICCFYGKGSCKIKVNNEILKEGGEFKDGETVNFCYPPRTEESSSEDCENKSLIDVIVNALS